jgi:hypothetical protein
MAGIVEQPDIGALQLIAEALHRPVKPGLVEIKLRAAADQREASERSVSAISLASWAGLSSGVTFL